MQELAPGVTAAPELAYLFAVVMVFTGQSPVFVITFKFHINCKLSHHVVPGKAEAVKR